MTEERTSLVEKTARELATLLDGNANRWQIVADFLISYTASLPAIAAWNRRATPAVRDGLVEATWPIDTDDQVDALALECGWNNRCYMTPADYSIWCERMRKFARLAANASRDTKRTAADLAQRCHEAADRVAKRCMGHDTPALISIPRQPTDIDAILEEAAAALSLRPAETRVKELEDALRGFPHFHDGREITAEGVVGILNEYEEMVMSWMPAPQRIDFIDQDGNTRTIEYEAGDLDIADAWVIPQEAGWRVASISEPARAEEGKEPVAWLDDIGNFWLTEEAGKSHNARPLYAAPSSSTLEITEEAVEAARQSLYRNPDIRAALEASLPFLSQTGGEKSDA